MTQTDMFVFTTLAILLSECVSAQVQNQDQALSAKGTSQISSTLRSRFQEDHPGNIRMQLHDVRAYRADPVYLGMPANRFIVLAKAVYYDTTGQSEQGASFGMFVFDDSLTSILRTIDIIKDGYDYTIYRVWKDTLTVHGELTGRDLQPIEKRYKLRFWERYK